MDSRNPSSLSKIGIAFSLAAAACTADADIVKFTSPADFAAIPGLVSPATDNFDNLELKFLASPTTRTVGAYSYAASASSGLFGAGSPDDSWLSTDGSGTSLLLSEFTGSVAAIGGYFFGSNLDGDFEGDNNITLTVTDSLGGTLSEMITSALLNSFRGFAVTDGTLVSLSIGIASSGSYATVNDLTLAQIREPTSQLPEPASLALVLAALVGVGATGVATRRPRVTGGEQQR